MVSPIWGNVDNKLGPRRGSIFAIFHACPPCGLADIPTASHAQRIKQGQAKITKNFLLRGHHAFPCAPLSTTYYQVKSICGHSSYKPRPIGNNTLHIIMLMLHGTSPAAAAAAAGRTRERIGFQSVSTEAFLIDQNQCGEMWWVQQASCCQLTQLRMT